MLQHIPQTSRLTQADAERVWRARDTYRLKGLLLTLALGCLCLVLTFVLGCEAYTRAVSPLSGFKGDPLPGPCAQGSLQAGTCLKHSGAP